MSWLRIFRMYWTTITMIRRKMNARNRNRYAGFDPMDARNPTICSQMLAISLRDHGVVIPAPEIPFHPQARFEDESGQLAVREEMIEPIHVLAPRPPRNPHVPGCGSTPILLEGPRLMEPGLFEGPHHQEHPPARSEDSRDFAKHGEAVGRRGQMMHRGDGNRRVEGRTPEREGAEVAENDVRIPSPAARVVQQS